MIAYCVRNCKNLTNMFADHELKKSSLKTNMDTQNDGLVKVSPFKHGNFWYLC